MSSPPPPQEEESPVVGISAPEVVESLVCEKCGLVANSSVFLVRHRIACRRYKVNVPGYQEVKKEDTSIPGEKMRSCPYCIRKPFGRTGNLRQHVRNLHPTQYPEFAASQDARRRRNRTSGEFVCTEKGCGYTTDKSTNLNAHRRHVHNPYKYPCPDPSCKKVWGSFAERTAHVRIRHPELHAEIRRKEEEIQRAKKEEEAKRISFECDLCHKILYTKSGLTGHKKLHAPKPLNTTKRSQSPTEHQPISKKAKIAENGKFHQPSIYKNYPVFGTVSNLSGLRNTNNMPTAQETDARIDEMRAKIQELLDNFFRDTGVRFYISYIMVCGDKVYFGTKILQNYTPIPCRIWKEIMLENEDGSKTIKLYEQDCYPGLQFELYGAEIFSCKESMQSEKLAYMDSSLADFDSSYRHAVTTFGETLFPEKYRQAVNMNGKQRGFIGCDAELLTEAIIRSIEEGENPLNLTPPMNICPAYSSSVDYWFHPCNKSHPDITKSFLGKEKLSKRQRKWIRYQVKKYSQYQGRHHQSYTVYIMISEDGTLVYIGTNVVLGPCEVWESLDDEHKLYRLRHRDCPKNFIYYGSWMFEMDNTDAYSSATAARAELDCGVRQLVQEVGHHLFPDNYAALFNISRRTIGSIGVNPETLFEYVLEKVRNKEDPIKMKIDYNRLLGGKARNISDRLMLNERRKGDELVKTGIKMCKQIRITPTRVAEELDMTERQHELLCEILYNEGFRCFGSPRKDTKELMEELIKEWKEGYYNKRQVLDRISSFNVFQTWALQNCKDDRQVFDEDGKFFFTLSEQEQRELVEELAELKVCLTNVYAQYGMQRPFVGDLLREQTKGEKTLKSVWKAYWEAHEENVQAQMRQLFNHEMTTKFTYGRFCQRIR